MYTSLSRSLSLSLSFSLSLYIYIHITKQIYIYIYRERERDVYTYTYILYAMHVSTVKRCSTCALLVNQHVNRLFRLRCMYNMSMCTCALLNRIVVLARICACVLYFCRTTEVLSETLKFENAGTDAAALRQGVRPRRAGLRRRRTGRRGKPSFKLAFSYSVCFTCASCLFMLRL